MEVSVPVFEEYISKAMSTLPPLTAPRAWQMRYPNLSTSLFNEGELESLAVLGRHIFYDPVLHRATDHDFRFLDNRLGRVRKDVPGNSSSRKN